MESRNVLEYAGWYASYLDDDQGKALIDCLLKRVKQQDALLERLSAEIELGLPPKEYPSEVVLNSLVYMISEKEECVVKKGYFEWYFQGE